MQAETIEKGMLWFDKDPQSDLLSKVNKAAAYYLQKYGQKPDLCFVHPSMLPSESLKTEELSIFGNPSMIPHHIWIGLEQENRLNI